MTERTPKPRKQVKPVDTTGYEDVPPPTDEHAPAEEPARKNQWAPSDPHAERAVIAAILNSPAVFDELVDTLAPEDFADGSCAAVYRAMLACDAGGRPIDQITIADELRALDLLKRVGGSDGLAELANVDAELANVGAHAQIVTEKAQLRRIIEAGRTMSTAAMKPGAGALEVREQAEKVVFDLGRERGRGSLLIMSEAVPAALAELTTGRSQLLLGHPTGYYDLDRLTGGFQPGHLITLAARPGVGKSALGLCIARYMAETTGLAVPFLSFEMSTSELMIRLLASAVSYDAMKLRQGDLPPGMDLDLAKAAERLSGVPLYIDDNPPGTIGGVRSAMRRLARRTQLGAVVVDYLQLMESERRRNDMNRTEEVSEISRGLKRLATELGVPVLALSQLSRAVEQRPNKRPVLSDLRESGSIEQDSNIVLFLYRDSMYNANADPNVAELILAKQRSGPSGVSIELAWHAPSATFRNLANGRSGPTQSGGGGSTSSYGQRRNGSGGGSEPF